MIIVYIPLKLAEEASRGHVLLMMDSVLPETCSDLL